VAIGSRSILRPTLDQLWVFLAVALPALAALLVPMPAVDLAYQLRAGASILAGDGIPTVDTWTFTAAGRPWVDQQWGAQALLAAVFQAGGWTGLAALRAGFVGLAFGFVMFALRHAATRAQDDGVGTDARVPAPVATRLTSVAATRLSPALSSRAIALIVLAAFVVAAPALALRPQLFAVVLFATELWILAGRRAHPRRVWLIPLLAAVWSNLHGSFPLALVLLGLAWLDDLYAPASRPRGGLWIDVPRRQSLLRIGVVSVIATFVNPFGTGVWSYVATLAGNTTISAQVSEWRPPSPLAPVGAIFFISLLAVVTVLLWHRHAVLRLGRVAFGPLATLAVFGVLGAWTGRGIAWWALAAPVSAVTLLARSGAIRAPARPNAVPNGLNAVVAAVLSLGLVALLPLWRSVGPAGIPAGVLAYAPQGIAVELAGLVDRGLLPAGAHVWNPQLWGSWLELSVPEVKIALDSRIELFQGSVWDDAELVATGNPQSPCVLDRHAVDAVIVASNLDALAAALEASPAWQSVHRDTEGSIWVRTKPPPVAPGC
jgi:hypothetical protein